MLIIVFLIIAFGLYYRSHRATMVGNYGEKKVNWILSTLPSSEYMVLNNVMLNVDEEGNTVQIDHIVVSIYGVFVIETKNYSGRIYGSEHAEYWKQYFRKSEYQLRNPIRQNKAHVNALRKMFRQYGEINLVSIIAFAGDASLHLKVDSNVVKLFDLRSLIRSYKTQYLIRSQCEKIVDLIELCRLTDKETLKRHNQSVEHKSFLSRIRIEQGQCPRCGSDLVLRSGRFGQFYGCSNYPKCKFTMER